MGYFGMMEEADLFIFYDDVQFSKQSWQQRNKIKSTKGDWIWLTVPVMNDSGDLICEKRIDNSGLWRKKHWRSIEAAYQKSPYFRSYSDDINKIYEVEWELISDLNIEIIDKLSRLIDINMPKIERSSRMGPVSGDKEERLLNLLELVGSTEYISGPSAKDYINPEDFSNKQIEIYWYMFSHPVYPQHLGDFISYLSVVDLLFNTGEKARQFIREGSVNAKQKA
jgi:hypothetical protein